jgi:hypothetical protein
MKDFEKMVEYYRNHPEEAKNILKHAGKLDESKWEENEMTDKELYNPDEFLLDDIKAYHYEVMDEGNHVWMAFYFENHKTGHLNIFLKDGKINTRYEEWDGP